MNTIFVIDKYNNLNKIQYESKKINETISDKVNRIVFGNKPQYVIIKNN